MRNLSSTISRLGAQRRVTAARHEPVPTPLVELVDFGHNPGCLRGWVHVPKSAGPHAALVVVLHGCTQDAATYDRGAGWSQLAEEQGFVLLFPEQRRANNLNLCFNWYEAAHQRRDAGEPLSIKRMIDAVIERYGVDPTLVYINGLSAGGAMTSVMLATYPELFAGGAIIAGLPFGSAMNMSEAFDRMRGHGGPSDADLGAAIRHASLHERDWPTISVWHGSADHLVDASNAEKILAQWRSVHALAAEPASTEDRGADRHAVWRDAQGRIVLERHVIAGMGHGTPIAIRGAQACGEGGPHMLDVGISSTRRIADGWHLARTGTGVAAAARTPPIENAPRIARGRPMAVAPKAHTMPPAAPGIAGIINDALRKAGLLQ